MQLRIRENDVPIGTEYEYEYDADLKITGEPSTEQGGLWRETHVSVSPDMFLKVESLEPFRSLGVHAIRAFRC